MKTKLRCIKKPDFHPALMSIIKEIDYRFLIF